MESDEEFAERIVKAARGNELSALQSMAEMAQLFGEDYFDIHACIKRLVQMVGSANGDMQRLVLRCEVVSERFKTRLDAINSAIARAVGEINPRDDMEDE